MKCPIYFNGHIRHIYVHEHRHLYVIYPLKDNKSIYRLVVSDFCKTLVLKNKIVLQELPNGYQYSLF